jgi:hypothetical protein
MKEYRSSSRIVNNLVGKPGLRQFQSLIVARIGRDVDPFSWTGIIGKQPSAATQRKHGGSTSLISAYQTTKSAINFRGEKYGKSKSLTRKSHVEWNL